MVGTTIRRDRGLYDSRYMTLPSNPVQGDVIYYDGTTWVNLGAGATGGFLQTQGVGANPQWLGGVQGDVLYHDGNSWANLGAGAVGDFLQTAGPGANPLWNTAIPAPAAPAQGDILYYDGANWVILGAGAAGDFLQTAGPGANPVWAAAAAAYIRSHTLVVAASNSNDLINADYFCDGVADEVQINAAITALPATGGCVMLMDGTFDIDASILINKNDVSLIGQGKSTIIVTDDAIRMVDTSTNSSRLLIRDIYFEGIDALGCYCIYLDGDYNTVACCYFHTSRYGIYITDNYNMIIDCYFRSCYNGIWFAGATHTNVIGCISYVGTYHNYFASSAKYNKIVGCSYYGGSMVARFAAGQENTITGCSSATASTAFAYLQVNSHNNVICGNTVNDAGNLVYITGADYCAITGNVAKYCAISIYLNDSYGCTISGNNIQDNDGTHGIQINTGGGHTITGNSLTKIDRHGIYILGADHNIISSNNIHDCSEDANDTYSGIYLTGTATYNVINGNRVSGDAANKHQYGYREAAAADDWNLVDGNIFTDAITTNLSTQGLNTVTGDNIAP